MISNFGSILLEATILKSVGMVTVSTIRVVMEILRSHNFSRWRSTFIPFTPTLAIVPPGVIICSHNSKVQGIPTTSMAVSTPRLLVNFKIVSFDLPSALLIALVAPKRLATSSRLSSKSIIMISAGE